MNKTTLAKWLIRCGGAKYLPALKRLAPGSEDFAHYYSDRILAAPVAQLRDTAFFPMATHGGIVDLNMSTPQLDAAASASSRPTSVRGLRPTVGGLAMLRSTIARQENERGRPTDADSEIAITAGASAGFAAICEAFLNPSDRVVIFDPSSPLFTLAAQSRRATVRTVRTTLSCEGMNYNADELSRALRGAKMVVVADPNNPTGASMNEAQREHLVWAAKRSDVLIVLDETFDRFRYEGTVNALPILSDARQRTLRLNSVSVSHGLSSARVGWVCGAAPLVQAIGLAALLASPYLSSPCQQIALNALSDDEISFAPGLQELRSRRNYTVERLRSFGCDVTMPQAGFFVWLDVSPFGVDGKKFAAELLSEAGVLVGPGIAYGEQSANFVRLSFGIEDGRLREGLRRLGQFIELNYGPRTTKTAEHFPEPLPTQKPTFSR